MLFFADKCPSCNLAGHKVSSDTMIHHVKDISRISDAAYYFCSTPECDIVYYSQDDLFTTSMVNKEIGIKSSSSDQALLCYCYNYPKAELVSNSLLDKIKIRIDNFGNRCDLRHPAGRCCMNDIKKIVAVQKVEF